MRRKLIAGLLVGSSLLAGRHLYALAKAPAGNALPHGQNAPPGPALSPKDAMAKMKLPDGFKIELVAGEPDIVNPTAFTFDDRGRIWVTESLEYPRKTPGKGQDRLKVLESTKNDGHFDKVTVFKDGLNIPCGVLTGNGGVYITNSPDVLFLQDADGDGKADKEDIILTGFGRSDTHELPNSLTWGPDGWLYGMNGVFNPATVKDPATGKVQEFTCAVWRYQVSTKKFELFAEGTSNPWGLDYNRQGDWFTSCCVIDHMFHITQSGYYHRQGGAYPPLTQPPGGLPSITTERHQAAAYSGLCLYDADAFPEQYRNRLIMGNLHGSVLNQDVLTRNGSTYTQHNAPEGDFLAAQDAWFMPVAQKIGPDGCLYLLDWYDRYHCYQDANRDSPGLDRTRGRLYRISYKGTPLAKPFDFQKMDGNALVKLLDHPNIWWRRNAQRNLTERFDPAMVPSLQKMAMDTSDKNNGHMHALWTLISKHAVDPAFHVRLLSNADAPTRNWGVRAAGELQTVSAPVFERLVAMSTDPSADVRLQLAVAAGRLTAPDPMPLFEALLANADNANDPLIPAILYNNLKPLATTRGKEILGFLEKNPKIDSAFGQSTSRWIRQAINLGGRSAGEIAGDLRKILDANPDAPRAAEALQSAIDSLSNFATADREKALDKPTRAALLKLASAPGPAQVSAVTMALWFRDPKAVEGARRIIADGAADSAVRVSLLKTIAEMKVKGNEESFETLAGDASAPVLLRQVAVDALGEGNTASAGKWLVANYPKMPADLKPMTMTAMTRSKESARALLDAVESKKIDPNDVTVNHIRQILGLGQAELENRVTATWGKIKTERDPERVKVVEQMKKMVTSHPAGDVMAGQAVFTKICAQCHTIYGAGGNVGPDLTGVGRENLDAILTNVLDPSLVIGAPYYVYMAKTKDGDTLSGILVENSDKQVVLKDQTKQMVVPKTDLEKLTVQNISMMPEGLEKNISEQEMIDLCAFLLTHEPPKPTK